MKIRYVGSADATEHTKTTAYGSTFVQGEWVAVPEGAESLATNPMFEVDADADGEPDATPSRRRKAAAPDAPEA